MIFLLIFLLFDVTILTVSLNKHDNSNKCVCTLQPCLCRRPLTAETLVRSQANLKCDMWWTRGNERVSFHQWPQPVHTEVQVRSPSSSGGICSGQSDDGRWFYECLCFLLSVWFHGNIVRVVRVVEAALNKGPNERQNGQKCVLNEKETWFTALKEFLISETNTKEME